MVDGEVGDVSKIRDFAPRLPTPNGFGDEGVRYTEYHTLDGQDLAGEVEGREDVEIEIQMNDFADADREIEMEDEGYGSEDKGVWGEGAGDGEADMSLEDGWGSMQLVRLEVEVLCGG